MRPAGELLEFDDDEQAAGMPLSLPRAAVLDAKLLVLSQLAILSDRVLELGTSPIRAEKGGMAEMQTHTGVLTVTLSQLTAISEASAIAGFEAYLCQQDGL